LRHAADYDDGVGDGDGDGMKTEMETAAGAGEAGGCSARLALVNATLH